jgi:hypothetical protein
VIRDELGADSLPSAIAGAALLMAIIAGLAAAGIDNAMPAAETASADGQADSLANECRLLLSMAPGNLADPGSAAGAFQVVELSLPADTEYLSFGLDPEAGRSHPGTIYYKVAGTKKAVVVDRDVRFLGPGGRSTEPGPVLRAGRCRVTIEHWRDALGQRYLLVR